MQYYVLAFFFLFASSCNKSSTTEVEALLPSCLQKKIEIMQNDPAEGAPMKITRYNYRDQIVYYMISPCCDKYNIVFDRVCTILGYPDGGFTGRGDGSMPDFFKEATHPIVVWKLRTEE